MAEPIITKFCVLCQTEKPTSEYYKRGKYLYKLCKACQGQENRDLYAIKQETKGRRIKRHGKRIALNLTSPYKRCAKCQTYKAKENFCSNKSRPDGLSDWCRNCHKARNDGLKARRDTVAASVKPIITEKSCSKCKAVKPVSEFYRNKYHSSGFNSQCKVCVESSPKREKKQKRIRERYICLGCAKVMWRRRDYKGWRGLCVQCAHPAQEHSATSERKKSWSPIRKWRKAVLERDGYMCQFCGSMERLEVDHILPWSTHVELRYEVSNGRTLCRPCHLTTDTYGGGAVKYKKVA